MNRSLENITNNNFMIYQWTFTEQEENSQTRSESEEKYLDTRMYEDLDAAQWGLDNYKYKQTAWIKASNLEDAFMKGNNCDSYLNNDMQIDEDHFNSLSVGDLVVHCGTSTVHMVMKRGFKRVYLNYNLEMLRRINTTEPQLH